MKKLFTICILTLFFACSTQQQSDKTSDNSAQTDKGIISKSESSAKTIEDKTINSTDYLTSTYDKPEFADKLKYHKETLKQLSEKKVFSEIDTTLKQTLILKHQEYFKTKADYELLSIAKGNLFQENKNDCAFVIYDKKNQRVSILVYNELTNKYFELFRELRVENGLETADCNYGAFGTLDYQLADEIVYQEEYLIKKPQSYLESTPCKIVDISKDEDFVLKSGCFSKNVSKRNLSNSLCIATSSVYNNWECLKYNKATNTFLIFYGQAFAD
ncbi:hypothetical protein [Frigoriflavimonas asaccharolytica]|uniref:Lipoprotein n=1 Tax=Frigoriflavimonas asaccharolytica TaxID=2735899 RepID=A0A8J8GAS5_9FLAO|nr:hypothetical protein [Frigoriflavimonas asaccharolytica]NRS94178.1 hypothetical protein [Frigoriflavimonas asaccharolytica]